MTVNRSQVGEGILRVVIASTSALPYQPTNLYQLRLRAVGSGTHAIRATITDARGVFGESITSTSVGEATVRVR